MGETKVVNETYASEIKNESDEDDDDDEEDDDDDETKCLEDSDDDQSIECLSKEKVKKFKFKNIIKNLIRHFFFNLACRNDKKVKT